MLQTVIALAGNVLGCEVRPTDRFFDLGGDSLAAVEFSMRLESELDMPIDLAELFEDDNVTAMAGALGRQVDERQRSRP